MTMDATSRVSEHARRFNAAVDSGRYDEFVAGFADDAVMSFVGLPFGPFRGRDEILEAYQAQPPTSNLTVTWVEGDDRHADARVAYSDGGTGTMALTWSGELVSELTVAFD